MRRTPASHNLSLIRLITFASVIGTQLHALSISAATPHVDASDRPTDPTAGSTRAATSTSSMSATLSTSTTTSALHASGAPRIKSSPGSASSSSTIMTPQGAWSSSSSSSTFASSSPSSSSPVNSAMKSSSRFPPDFPGPKSHWSKAEGAVGGAQLPSAATTADVEKARTFRSKHHHEHHWGPFFEEPLNSTLPGDNLLSTAHLYTEAALNCRVGMLKDKTVMWVRRTTEKVSLLTVGNVTYSGDPRIRVKFQYPNNWRLLINPTQAKDAGVYMCQVSTHPPRVFTTNLTILEPPLRLIDEQEREVSDRYYKSGSTIDLQCQVSRSFLYKERLSILKSLQLPPNQTKTSANSNTVNALVPEVVEGGARKANQTAKAGATEKEYSNFIFWTKDDEELPAAAVTRTSSTEKWLSSRISIPDARLADSGNYSCAVGKLFRAIVQVQVLTGELPAAVQHNAAPAPATHLRLHPQLLLPLFLPWICAIAAWHLLALNISPSTRPGPKRIRRSSLCK